MSVVQTTHDPTRRHLSLIVCSESAPNDTSDTDRRDRRTTDDPIGQSRGADNRHTRSAPAIDRETQKRNRARRLAELSADARQLRNRVLREALASGYPINPDAVSAILAAKALKRGPLRYFTEDTVWDLVWFDISHWCGSRDLDLPDGLHRALWFVLDYLDASNELHPHSDHLDDLRAPLVSSTGLGPDGQPRFGF